MSVTDISSVLNISNKTTRAYSPSSVDIISRTESTQKNTESYSSNSITALSQHLIPVKVFSGINAIQSNIDSVRNLNTESYNLSLTVATSKDTQHIKTEHSSVCVPIAIVNGVYYWQCYESIDEDDNTSIIEEDCN